MNIAKVIASLLLAHKVVSQGAENGQGLVRGAELKRYILTFNPEHGPTETAKGLAKLSGGRVKHVYSKVLNGATLTIPVVIATGLLNHPAVATMEEDQEVTAFSLVIIQSYGQSQSHIDQCESSNLGTVDSDSFDCMDASDVRVYILETGIHGMHSDFTGKIGPQGCHKSKVQETPLNDGHGHGTHITLTVCDHLYGVVACEELCAVQVLSSSGSGSTSGVIAGVNFVASNWAGQKCVANMSLGGSRSFTLDIPVNTAITSSVTFVVAAGNSNDNACNYSPAAANKAITVGALDSNDTPASFTNYGSCVNIYAPGVSIKAAWKGGIDATNTIRVTSMCLPTSVLSRQHRYKLTR